MIKPIRNTGLRLEQLDDVAVILDLRRKQLLHINAAATLVWVLCDGLHSIDDIVAEVGLGANDKALVRRDVVMVLGQMIHNGLIRDFGSLEEPRTECSTRQHSWQRANYEESPSILSVMPISA